MTPHPKARMQRSRRSAGDSTESQASTSRPSAPSITKRLTSNRAAWPSRTCRREADWPLSDAAEDDWLARLLIDVDLGDESQTPSTQVPGSAVRADPLP